MSYNHVDHEKLIALLKSNQYTQGEIAKMVGCGIRTVGRIAKANNLAIGQGRRPRFISRPNPSTYWEFNKMSAELAYIIGLYLTDGTMQRNRYGKPQTVTLSSSTPEIIDRLEECFTAIGLKTGRDMFITKESHYDKANIHIDGGTKMEVIYCCASMFSHWLFDACQGKERIPQVLLDARLDSQVSAISAIIDGDGSVTRKGSIRVRCTCGWMHTFPALLTAAGIRPGKLLIDRVIEGSNKLYYSVAISRKHFAIQGGYCYHPKKQYRIEHGKADLSNVKFAPKEKVLCPVCGKGKMWPESEMCRSCYLKSDKFHELLKSIAPAGNKAANIARWGHKE